MTQTEKTQQQRQDDTAEPIALTIEIDPSEFDEPRQLMYERLVEEYGHETIAELIGANLQQDLTAQGTRLVNALWDNRDQIAVEPDGVETPKVPDGPGGEHD